MSEPQTQPAHPVAPPPQSVPLVQRVAEILAAGLAINAAAEAIEALLAAAAGIARPPGREAITAALGLARHASTPRTQLARHGLSSRGTPTAAAVARTAANADLYYRAAYVIAASGRMQERINNGASVREAIGAEAGNYEAHRAARENRLEVAARVGGAAELFGPLLGWYRDAASNSEQECYDADGCNFYAEQAPLIGFPGAVHPHCRCVPGPPHLDAPLVDEALGHDTRMVGGREQRRIPARPRETVAH